MDEGSSSGVLLKQTLMSNSECFVYKVPPLATASGYRANDWNLATPLETCGFQVERRNNDLYLLFTLENHTKLFALSKIEGEGSSINNINVETVLDSSRYFVCKILESNTKNATTKATRTALLGFGFRERDIAIDLLGNLQQFRQSIDRELEAKDLASKTKSIPILAEGEKLHVRIPGMGPGKTTTLKKNKVSGGGGGTPILLKKPPPSALETPFSPFEKGKRFRLSSMECPLTSMTFGGGDMEALDDDSEAAMARSVVDDFLSVDDDEDLSLDEPNDNGGAGEGGGNGFDDEQSEGAVGGGTIHDDDTSDDSFQFSELNLDDMDNDDKNDKKDEDKEAPASGKADDEFGDFKGA